MNKFELLKKYVKKNANNIKSNEYFESLSYYCENLSIESSNYFIYKKRLFHENIKVKNDNPILSLYIDAVEIKELTQEQIYELFNLMDKEQSKFYKIQKEKRVDKFFKKIGK